MSEQVSIVEAINSSNGYLIRGNNFIQKLSKEDISEFKENDKIFIEVSNEEHSDLNQVVKDIFDKITQTGFNDKEFNIIFSGKLQNTSQCVMEKWLITSIYHSTNSKSRLLINEKLKHVKSIVGAFFTVFDEFQKESVRCTVKYTLVIDADKSFTDLLVTPEWYDMTLSHGGNETFKAYKLFYILAALSDKGVDQGSRLVDYRALTALSKEYYNAQERKLVNSLKEIKFTQSEIEELFDSLYAMLELSQYSCRKIKKNVEFLGLDHANMAARRLKVKLQELTDFLYQEYTWKDNKQKLNTPENINRGINSFICKLYEVIITVIFNKLNAFSQSTIQSGNKININFLYSPTMPRFDEQRSFTYGDFLQYATCSNFQFALSTIIADKERELRNYYTKGRSAISNPIDSIKNPRLTTLVSELVNNCKGEKNAFEYLKKAEQNCGNQIRFSKETTIWAHIFIPELKNFLKFNWESFVDNSETYDNTKMKMFLRISSSSIFRKYKTEISIQFLPERERMYQDFTLNIPMSLNTFSVHSLLDDNLQTGIKYPLNDQVLEGRLEFLSIIELCLIPIRLDVFVPKYRPLFLNYDDQSKTLFDASKHAIKLLRLDQTWCCQNYVHISPQNVDKLDKLILHFMENVLSVQRFFRQIIAKIKLRKLRLLAQEFKGTYNNLLSELEALSRGFEEAYMTVCMTDLECRDSNLLRSITATMDTVEEMKIEPVKWLSVVVMSESVVLAKTSFSNSKLCISFSNDGVIDSSNSFDLQNLLPPTIDRSKITNRFIIKISHHPSGDVILELKSTKELYAWNFETETNKRINSHLSASSGNLYSNREYRLFSMSYIWKKIAYCLINRVPYSFSNMARECSFAIILERDPTCDKSLSRAPLWLYFTDFYPILNLSSHYFFTKVEEEIRKIDKSECLQFVKGPSIRPKDDWLTEDVYTQLMLVSLEKEEKFCEFNSFYFTMHGRVSNPRPSILSTLDKPWSKINYKLRKYVTKDYQKRKDPVEFLL